MLDFAKLLTQDLTFLKSVLIGRREKHQVVRHKHAGQADQLQLGGGSGGLQERQ